MTHGGSDGSRPTKNERREAARAKARALREQQRRAERRNRWIIQGGLVMVCLAIVAIVAIVIVNSIRPAAPGPRNMATDGIKIGQDLKAVTTPALSPGAAPSSTPTDQAEADDPIAIRLYVDYQCPHCRDFETANADQLAAWLNSGAATVEIHPIAILNNASQGTQYSTRAANAAACVADRSPDSFWAFNQLLFANQPEENTPGLPDSKLIALTEEADVANASAIADCIRDGTFRSWVSDATSRAVQGPVPDSNVARVISTPTVIVNGLEYPGAFTDADAFASFVFQAEGNSFVNNPSPSPSPDPEAAPGPGN